MANPVGCGLRIVPQASHCRPIARPIALDSAIIERAFRAFGRRTTGDGRADADTMARLRFALLDAPFGGIKPYVQARKPLPAALDDLVAVTARAVFEPVVGRARPRGIR